MKPNKDSPFESCVRVSLKNSDGKGEADKGFYDNIKQSYVNNIMVRCLHQHRKGMKMYKGGHAWSGLIPSLFSSVACTINVLQL
jgi:hypothetical protein